MFEIGNPATPWNPIFVLPPQPSPTLLLVLFLSDWRNAGLSFQPSTMAFATLARKARRIRSSQTFNEVASKKKSHLKELQIFCNKITFLHWTIVADVGVVGNTFSILMHNTGIQSASNFMSSGPDHLGVMSHQSQIIVISAVMKKVFLQPPSFDSK